MPSVSALPVVQPSTASSATVAFPLSTKQLRRPSLTMSSPSSTGAFLPRVNTQPTSSSSPSSPTSVSKMSIAYISSSSASSNVESPGTKMSIAFLNSLAAADVKCSTDYRTSSPEKSKDSQSIALPSPVMSRLQDQDDTEYHPMDMHPISRSPSPISPAMNVSFSNMKMTVDDLPDLHKPVPRIRRWWKKPSDASEALAPPRRFTCPYEGCGRVFTRGTNMRAHQVTHYPDIAPKYQCDLSGCHRNFTRKHDLQRHQTTVHKHECKHLCPVCNEAFSRADGLRRHRVRKEACRETGMTKSPTTTGRMTSPTAPRPPDKGETGPDDMDASAVDSDEDEDMLASDTEVDLTTAAQASSEG